MTDLELFKELLKRMEVPEEYIEVEANSYCTIYSIAGKNEHFDTLGYMSFTFSSVSGKAIDIPYISLEEKEEDSIYSQIKEMDCHEKLDLIGKLSRMVKEEI